MRSNTNTVLSFPVPGPEDRVRAAFPFSSHHPNLAYLDSAASTQKPQVVVDTIANYYSHEHANIHRGVYTLSQEATRRYDEARQTVARFLGAAKDSEVVFVRGATEACNLLAQCFLKPRLKAGDEVLVSVLEHHANIVPWQMACREAGATLRAIPLTTDQQIDLNALEQMLSPKTKLLAITHVSNALGSVTDLPRAIALAKKHAVPVVVDGAQAVAHLPVSVRELDCDFYLFSGHKLYGPTGIGALYGKEEHLQSMPPYQFGGDMIELVQIEESTFQPAPQRFEAGTPHIAGAIGLAAAIDFVDSVGFETICLHERVLHLYAEEILAALPGIRCFGPTGKRVGSISFIADWGHPHDIATILDQHQVAVRAGHHCAQPLMRYLEVGATTRISFGAYTTTADLDQFATAMKFALSILQ
jgi:cysteine desulfurase/selenocysteine lyase